MSIPAAQPGDVCVIVEPSIRDLPRLRRIQQGLQQRYGGRPQTRIHFTCQRFTPPQNGGLPQLIADLRRQLNPLAPIPVTAAALEWTKHPFWGCNVLRWDLNLSAELLRFGRLLEEALLRAGAQLQYPRGAGWRPHVTALERMPDRETEAVEAPAFPHLYTADRIVLSQVQPGKRFAILDTIQLMALRVRQPAVSRPAVAPTELQPALPQAVPA
jgi:hypothetical protein